MFSGNIAGEKKKDLQRHDMSPRTNPHFVSSSLTTTLATKRRPERHANHGYRKVKPRRESMTGGPHLAILPGRAKNGMPVVHTVVLFPPVPFRFFISQEGQLLHFFFLVRKCHPWLIPLSCQTYFLKIPPTTPPPSSSRGVWLITQGDDTGDGRTGQLVPRNGVEMGWWLCRLCVVWLRVKRKETGPIVSRPNHLFRPTPRARKKMTSLWFVGRAAATQRHVGDFYSYFLLLPFFFFLFLRA